MSEQSNLRPWDGKEFFFKRPFNPISMSVEEARLQTKQWCDAVGMEYPPTEPVITLSRKSTNETP